MRLKFIISIVVFYIALMTNSVTAKPVFFEDDGLWVRVATNAPQPIGAFYEGRGFPKEMIKLLQQQCFVSIRIKNKSNDFIWLDLSQWEFTDSNGKVTRRDRNYWKARWQEMNIPLAHQSTFRWTMLPEILDFYPKEQEGGNIILPRTGKPFSIRARFDTGKDRKGKPIHMQVNNITCATDQ